MHIAASSFDGRKSRTVAVERYLFVVHSPYQFETANNIAIDLRQQNPTASFELYVEGENHYDVGANHWQRTASLCSSNGQRLGWHAYRCVEHSLETILDTFDKNSAPTASYVFLSDLLWGLNNRIAYALSSLGVRVALFEDGIANYVHEKAAIMDYIRFSARYIGGRLCVMPRFEFYTGLILGQESEIVDAVYLYHPEWLQAANPTYSIAKIHSRKKYTNAFKRGVLVADAPHSRLLNKKTRNDFENTYVHLIEALSDGEPIYLKRHPRDPDGTQGLRIENRNIEIIHSHETTESIAASLGVRVVVALASTTLINLGTEFARYAVLPGDRYLLNNRIRNNTMAIRPILNRAGVGILEVR